VFWKLNQGFAGGAPASEAHDVRISGHAALLCKVGLLIIRNWYYNLIAVLLQ
jgi:hypothetical protein